MRADATTRHLRFVGAALLCGTAPVAAQQLDAGQRIRVTVPALQLDRQVGSLRWLDRDSVVIDTDLHRLAMAPGQVSRLDVSRGRKGHTLLGLGIGAAVGLGAGFLLFQPGSSQCTGSGDYEENCMLYRAGVMVGGAVAGALAGTFIRTERWEALPLPSVP
ncbi:MAG: hypothetical protein MUC69_06275 [Gemmatimonadales bacterium]|nr:hypothetical protein [Gemmatimonadales bacterium]